MNTTSGGCIASSLVARLYDQAKADRWLLPVDLFAAALQASAARAFGKTPDARSVERYLSSLHLEDLALACACAAGHDAAWEHFIREQRPRLYRAADALDATGGARELADSLYADLYGLQDHGERRSLFRYFHGRSSLSTWLRAVLAQRHVDRVRVGRRFEPLGDDEPSASSPPDPDRSRYQTLLRRALDGAVRRLAVRDRLRLGCYYAQQLTLDETGRVLREHAATVSRQLARTRVAIRTAVEQHLRDTEGLGQDEVARCFELAAEDPGCFDLNETLEAERKETASDRSSIEIP